MVRPTPLQWIWYTFGGRLRPINRGWVLHDTTCRTRWLRQGVRGAVQVALPAALVIAVVLAVVGDNWVIWAGVACGAILALWYSLAYIDQTAERRLVKHGYEPGTLEQVLHERHRSEHADEIARYMQMYRS
jgi:Family of unknown function (DUF5313)